ncbi:MAG TPA: hypothetical protein PKE45_22550, partial [Caldilineaceae bacterium]|nr:hypothetical protein [Caldilineaceae bacterium]
MAALGFGLLAPSWPLEAQTRSTPERVRTKRQRTAQFLLALAVVAALGSALYLGVTGADGWLVQILWAGAVLLFLGGLLLSAAGQSYSTPGPESTSPLAAKQRWPVLLLLLVGVGMLVWSWRTVPAAPDPVLAAEGLQALALSKRAESPLFFPA